jgi:hypothetical protein
MGEVVAKEWLKIPRNQPRVHLDEWIIMPDHMHGILIFHDKEPDTGLPAHPTPGCRHRTIQVRSDKTDLVESEAAGVRLAAEIP